VRAPQPIGQAEVTEFMLNFSNEGQNDSEAKKTLSALFSRHARSAPSDISGAFAVIEFVAKFFG